MRRLTRSVAIALLLALSACAINNAHEASNSKSAQVVAQYFAALNQRDLLALTLYVTPDFEWYSVIGHERTVEVSNREELKAMLMRYFDQSSRTRWTVLNTTVSEPFVTVTERSQWEENGHAMSRDSVGVFEIESGRIRRVTYFLNGR